MKYKTSEAHRRASKKYRQENKDTERIHTYRRTARLFINKHADIFDLFHLQQLINRRLLSLIEEGTEKEKESVLQTYFSIQKEEFEKQQEKESE